MGVHMRSVVRKADQFLQKYGVSADTLPMTEYCDWFLQEMKEGLANGNSSLKMIPTYIEIGDSIPYDTDVIVIDAGGTNLRTALVRFSEKDGVCISDFRKCDMPGAKTEVSAKEFFHAFGDAVEPIFTKSDHIGFCFSYAAAVTPERDGRLIVFSKEIKAPEVIGKLVGSELLEEMHHRGYTTQKRLTLLNDTVATLLACKGQPSTSEYSGYIGLILGTGTNTSYIERNSAIRKLDTLDPSGSQIINIESGNFAVPATPLDKEFFAITKDPEVYHFEKLISGAYLGSYGHMVLRKAIDGGLFSTSFSQDFLQKVSNLDTITMDRFLHSPNDRKNIITRCCADDEDAVLAFRLLDGVIERAAKLTAVNLAATVIQSQAGKDPRHPVCINIDGTTYYRTHNLKKYVEWYLHEYLEKEIGRYYEFVTIEQSPILGAAIAGLLA